MVNKAILIGNLGRDPESRQAGNSTVCNVSIATNENYKDKSGEWQTNTDWHNLTAWGATAEKLQRYKRGETLYVEGKIKTDKYQDKDGRDLYKTYVLVEYCRRVSKSEQGSNEANKPTKPEPTAATNGATQDDDLPF